ncbi:MAG: HAD family hydrolase [Planctomycetota bacterium]
MKRPAVFLDRDNTLIHNDGDLGDPEAVRLIRGAAPAVASVCGLGYRVVVVTNQGGVARGAYTEADVDAVHDRIETLIRQRANGARIDAFYFCPFHPQGTVAAYKKEHPTRKPKPGMLTQAAADLDLDLSQSWMVGDALRDVEAGAAAGCRTVLLSSNGDGEPELKGKRSRGKRVEPDFVARSLVEAVRVIASQRKPEAAEAVSRARIAGKRWDAEAMAELQASPRKDVEPGPEAGREEAEPKGGKPRPFVPWTAQPGPEEVAPPEGEPPPAAPEAEPAASVAGPPPPVEIAPEPEVVGPLNKTMRLVLQELRMQRGSSGEVPQLGIVALALQALAAICLLGALWMGGGAGGDGAFLRWMGVAVFLQLAVIATLLFTRPS